MGKGRGIALFLCVVERWLHVTHAEVRNARKANNFKQHISAKEQSRSSDVQPRNFQKPASKHEVLQQAQALHPSSLVCMDSA